MQLTAPQPDRIDALADLFAMTFSDYWDRSRYVHDGYITDSSYDWAASRIGVEDDRIVTHFGVWDFGMRIGSVACRMAGIGAVETHDKYRKRGLMAQTAADCVSGLRGAGYDLSLLFGIPGFYHRFGYVRSFGEGTFTLTTRDLPVPERAPEYKPYTGDVASLAAMYNAENERVTGTYVRPTYRLNRKPKTFGIYAFDGGYVIAGRVRDAIELADCAGDPATIVAILRDLAVREICAEISLVFLPRRSRLGEYVQTLSHRFTLSRNASGGPMFRLVNLPALAGKLIPVFNERLAAAGEGVGGYSGSVVLCGHDEAVALEISGGTVDRIEPVDHKDAAIGPVAGCGGVVDAGHALVRFFVGDDHPDRICVQTGATLSGDARWLAPTLFPDQEPSTILWDRF
ncbi:MAG: GNAT family N-acetyltransferase [Spirochaetaceae bacterium]|nr:MAG: GNAT family N-acetyltransferase [Spirochaetaceae bacterium]